MPDLTLTQFILIAVIIIGAATAAALIIITMRASPQYEEDEIPQAPKVKRWPVDYGTEHL